MIIFDTVRDLLKDQFTDPAWIVDSGLDEAALTDGYNKLYESLKGQPKAIIKAKTFEYLLKNGCIAADKDDIFQDKLRHFRILEKQRSVWYNEVVNELFPDEKAFLKATSLRGFGAYTGDADFGHTSPNTRFMMEVGFTGILERVKQAARICALAP